MTHRSLFGLSDHALLQELRALLEKERAATVEVVLHIAEVDRRRLWSKAGHANMYRYCLAELRMSEQAAFKRIRAGRAVRRYPAVLEALVEGRLHLSAIVELATYLRPDNAEELIAAASHRTCAEIRHLLAARYPRPDVPMSITPVMPVVAAVSASVPAPCVSPNSDSRVQPGNSSEMGIIPLSSKTVSPQVHNDEPVYAEPTRTTVEALSAQSYRLQVTLRAETREKLQRARELLSHAVPGGDVPEVLDRALDALIEKLERRSLGSEANPRPRPCKPGSDHVPAHVKREVMQRDGGKCSLCGSRWQLQFDHVTPLARGGQSTAGNLRILCQACNQREAERVFGPAMIRNKRE